MCIRDRPMTCMGNYQKAVDFAKEANEYALKLKEDGIDLYYHNHHVEFVRYDGEFLLDIIRANAPALGFELDSHWIHRGGQDPVKFIKKYAGSIRLVHLCLLYTSTGNRSGKGTARSDHADSTGRAAKTEERWSSS